jgi:hypothetical protein
MPAQAAPSIDPLTLDRPDLAELSAEQIAPIDARTDGWPESWCDLARSLYVTLTTRAEPLAGPAAITLAMELTLGIAADLGGEQRYIPIGCELQRSALAVRVIDLLRQHHQDYDCVGQLVGKTGRHVRRIEGRWLRAERARRQGTLELE